MKKLLVLVMVLGLVATANAGLCTISGGTQMVVGATETIAVMSADTSGQTLNLEIDDTLAGALAQTGTYTLGDWVYTGGTVQGMTSYAAAGNLSSIWGPAITTYPGYYVMTGAGTPPSGIPTAGEWFSIVYKATGVGTEYLTLYSDSGAEISQIAVKQTAVPEPITMALLGLGGLFLRRRSK